MGMGLLIAIIKPRNPKEAFFSLYRRLLSQVIDICKYWEALSSSLGWINTVVKILHLTWILSTLSAWQLQNGLVQQLLVLFQRTRMRLAIENGKLGECFKAKPDFIKAWVKWRSHNTKLDCCGVWLLYDHCTTWEGLKGCRECLPILTMPAMQLASGNSCSFLTFYMSEH
ncbi:hypothetical protein M0R45_007662 [Rubus argutus]|uniref:Uncharacterized protein n=1 Tax=Rubus argutus TaxID=59490 RepID=A0AAW1Y2A8_RUBAR